MFDSHSGLKVARPHADGAASNATDATSDTVISRHAWEDVHRWHSALPRSQQEISRLFFDDSFYNYAIAQINRIVDRTAQRRGGARNSVKTMLAVAAQIHRVDIAAVPRAFALLAIVPARKNKYHFAVLAAACMEIPAPSRHRGMHGNLYMTREFLSMQEASGTSRGGLARVFTAHALERLAERAFGSHLTRSEQVDALTGMLLNRKVYPSKMAVRNDGCLSIEVMKSPQGLVYMSSAFGYINDPATGSTCPFMFYRTIMSVDCAGERRLRQLTELGLTEDTWHCGSPDGWQVRHFVHPPEAP